MTGGRRVVGVCAWLTLAVGAVFLGVRAYRSLEVTSTLISPKSRADARVAYRNYECLDEAFRALVPAGARVFIDIGGLTGYATLSSAFPEREVVGTPSEADVVFGFRDPSKSSEPCAPGAFHSVSRASRR